MKSLLPIAIILLSLIPSHVMAQSVERPLPPQTVVAYVYRSDIWQVDYPAGATTYDAAVNLTFPKSPEDDGTFQYNLRTEYPDGFIQLNSNIGGAIPGRSNWLYHPFEVASANSGILTFNLTANNTAGQESDYSCSITVNLRVNQTLNQCGNAAQAPSGFLAFVTNATVPGDVGTVGLIWNESTDDIDSDWTYRLYVALLGGFTGYQLQDIAAMNVPHTGTDRITEIVPSGFGLGKVWFKVAAYDNLTRWTSTQSCFITVDIGRIADLDACGDIVVENYITAFPDPTVDRGLTTPQYPLVNLTQLSDAFGVSQANIGYLLAFVSILGLALIGFYIGGPVVGITLGVLGVGAATALLLIEVWWVVVLFMIMISLVIFAGRGGQQ